MRRVLLLVLMTGCLLAGCGESEEFIHFQDMESEEAHSHAPASTPNVGTQSIHEILIDLGHTDKTVREKAKASLASLSPGVVQILCRIIEGGNDDDLKRALIALHALGPRASKAVACLKRILENPQAKHRRHAAYLLADIGLPGLPSLVVYIHDADYRVRRNVGRLLTKVGKKAVPDLLKLLQSGNEDEQVGAAAGLARVGVPCEAMPILERTLQSNSYRVRACCLSAMRTLGRQGIQHLISGMNDKHPKVRLSAARALGDCVNITESGVEALIEGISDSEHVVREASIYSLGDIGPQANAAVPELLGILDSNEWGVCGSHSASQALVKIGVCCVTPLLDHLRRALADKPEKPWSLEKSRRVSWHKDTLAGIGHLALPYLLQSLRNGNDLMREYTARILQGFDPGPESVPSLVEAIGDECSEVRGETIEVFKSMDERSVPPLLEALQTARGVRRAGIFRAFGNMGEKAFSAAPACLRALSDPDEGMHYSAALSLAGMGQRCIPLLLKALQSQDPLLRKGAVRSLGLMWAKANEAVPALIAVLDDPDVRSYAIEALARIRQRPELVVPALSKTIEKSSGQVRYAAIAALRAFPPKSLPVLIRLLSHGDRTVRESALSAFRVMGTAARPAVPAIIETLKDSDLYECMHKSLKREAIAVYVLWRIKPDASAFPALEKIFTDCSYPLEARWSAVEIFSNILSNERPESKVRDLQLKIADVRKELRSAAESARE